MSSKAVQLCNRMNIFLCVLFCVISLSRPLPDFRIKLFYASLQKDSHLKPQKGAYLQDSFRVDTLAPFAGAVVTSLTSLDKRLTAAEYSSLCFRLAFISGLLTLALGIAIAILKRPKKVMKVKNSSVEL